MGVRPGDWLAMSLTSPLLDGLDASDRIHRMPVGLSAGEVRTLDAAGRVEKLARIAALLDEDTRSILAGELRLLVEALEDTL